MASLSAPSSVDIERLQQELRQMKSTVHGSLRDILAQKDQEIARITQENQRLSAALGEQHAIAEEAMTKLSEYRGAAASIAQLEGQRYHLEQQMILKDREIQALRVDLAGARRQFDYQNETRRRAEQTEAENNAALRAELEAVRPRVAELVELNETLQRSVDACMADLTFARREYERLFAEHSALQSESARLRSETTALRGQLQVSEEAEAASLAFKRRLRQALPEMTGAVESTLQAMDDTLNAMRVEAEASARERAEQARQLATQGSELQSLRSERQRTSDLEGAQRGMRAALGELHAQLQANSTHFAALRDLVVRASEDAKPLKELQHKEAELERLTGELNAVQTRLTAAEGERAQWQRRASDSSEHVARLEHELRLRDNEVARITEEERQARIEGAKQLEANATLQESARALRTQLAELRRANEEELKRTADLREQQTRLEAQRRTLEERVTAARNEADAQSKEAARVHAELLVERATRRQEAEVNLQLKQLAEKMRAQLAGLLDPSVP